MLNFILFTASALFFVFIATVYFLPVSFDEEITPSYSVLTVKDKEDCIEGILRTLAHRINTADYGFSSMPKELIVLDLGSHDRTFEIAKALSVEYPFIHPMRKAEYIEFIDKM